MNRKKLYFVSAGIIILIIIVYFLFFRDSNVQQVWVKAKKGVFQIEVVTTGELIAQNSDKIMGPIGLNNLRGFNDVKILDIIPDGTVVKEGDFVASLDPTELLNRVKDEETNLEKSNQTLLSTKLDTSEQLSNARDDLINLKYSIQERELALKQSDYETEETKRKIKMDLEKAERDLQQAEKNYKLKLLKSKANMSVVNGQYDQAKRKLEQLQDLLKGFTILAPRAGMVIYHKNWQGIKQGKNSTFSPWENVVAEFPDLSKMISKTYVNEIDISKVKTGQNVRISIDAFPEKQFTGKVISAANIGEQPQNSNAKVFEVQIIINESDSVLRPAMTTKNTILTAMIDSVIFVPIEAVFGNDSLSFVYKKARSKVVKQQVIGGQSNENEIIIKAGLLEDDEVMLVPPEKSEDLKFLPLSVQEIEKFKVKPVIPVTPDTLKTDTLKKPGKEVLPPKQSIKLKTKSN
jgi:multidrug efflux pump subunit AcrA (membrane-fusion protein)